MTRDGHLAFRVRRAYHAANEFKAVCFGVLDADDDRGERAVRFL